ALLGADVVRAPDGRWVVERVLPGESSDPQARSPFAAPGVAVREGDEILAVDGRPVDPVYGPWPALAGTHGKPVELTIKPADPSLVPRPPAPAEEDKAEDSDSEKDDAASPVKDEAKEGAKTAPASAAAPHIASLEDLAASAEAGALAELVALHGSGIPGA